LSVLPSLLLLSTILTTTFLFPKCFGFETNVRSFRLVPTVVGRFGVVLSRQDSTIRTFRSSTTALSMSPIMGGLEQREGPTPTGMSWILIELVWCSHLFYNYYLLLLMLEYTQHVHYYNNHISRGWHDIVL
jgi:hypothetical protein